MSCFAYASWKPMQKRDKKIEQLKQDIEKNRRFYLWCLLCTGAPDRHSSKKKAALGFIKSR